MNMVNIDAYDVPTAMRTIAETGIEQGRRAFGTFVAAARRNAEIVQGTAAFFRISTLDMTARGFAYAEQNVHAALDFAQKLAHTRDPQEAIQVQLAFVQERFGALQDQASGIGGLTQNAMQQGAEQVEQATSALQENTEQAAKVVADVQDAAQQTVETTFV